MAELALISSPAVHPNEFRARKQPEQVVCVRSMHPQVYAHTYGAVRLVLGEDLAQIRQKRADLEPGPRELPLWSAYTRPNRFETLLTTCAYLGMRRYVYLLHRHKDLCPVW